MHVARGHRICLSFTKTTCKSCDWNRSLMLVFFPQTNGTQWADGVVYGMLTHMHRCIYLQANKLSWNSKVANRYQVEMGQMALHAESKPRIFLLVERRIKLVFQFDNQDPLGSFQSASAGLPSFFLHHRRQWVTFMFSPSYQLPNTHIIGTPAAARQKWATKLQMLSNSIPYTTSVV